ncbi:MAG: hypothetical protein MHM6MM_005338 [Cercozoa sp. M6MM]
MRIFCDIIGQKPMLWVFLLGILVTLIVLIRRSLPRGKVARDRVDAPGKFVRLSRGNVHYLDVRPGQSLHEAGQAEDADDVDDRILVLVHGITTSSTAFWPHLGDQLTKVGKRRVIALDLYGRGWSESDDTMCMNEDFFADQLAEFLRTVIPEKQFALLGWSMGGAVCARFCHRYAAAADAEFASLLNNVIFMSPAGLPTGKPFAAKLVHVPVLSDLLASFVAPALMIRNAKRDFLRLGFGNDMLAQVEHNVREYFGKNPGMSRSLLSTLRHFRLDDLEHCFAALAPLEFAQRTRVHVVWGTNDTTCPFRNCETLQVCFYTVMTLLCSYVIVLLRVR